MQGQLRSMSLHELRSDQLETGGVQPVERASLRPKRGQTFAKVVHTDGVAASLMFTRPKPAEPPGELPCMGKEEGAVNPLAGLGADWLGCDPGKTNMATAAHEQRYPSGAVKSSGITEHAKESKAWMAGIKPQLDEMSQVINHTVSLQRYRQYADTVLANWPDMWAELSKANSFRPWLPPAKERSSAQAMAHGARLALYRESSGGLSSS
ncbi:hypothetical protein QJQ45_008183 [Haematococcus lacustris]|nr:hypothetical protein QJQ45_008183 [Haematococcus lacustris]